MGMTQIAPGIRVEDCAPRVTVGAAGPANLDNKVTPARYQIGARGSDGGIIVEGEPFEYLDDYAERVWQVYQETEVQETLRGEPVTILRYLPVGQPHETEGAAIASARALIGSV